jgi:magnesium-protoporphyrin O-methyltransferase
VVLHRVVCCYPDYARLLSAAAGHTRRLLVLSYPPDNPVSKAIVRAPNMAFAARRMRYRACVHPVDRMLAILAEHDLRAAYSHRGPVWQIAGLAR